MKVLGISGGRWLGNSEILVKEALMKAEEQGGDVEFLSLMDINIKPPSGEDMPRVSGDSAATLNKKMTQADGIILGSPTYFSDVSTEMKALIDRAGYVARANSFMLKRKIGASVVAVRRAGAIPTFDSMNHFFLIGQMIVVGSSYWNVGIGLAKGDVEQDEEGIETMQTLGQNMAWLLKKINQ